MNVESFEKLHGFFIEDLKVGQKAIFKKKITENDINQFSLVTGDNNPVHINEDFAKHTIFKKKNCSWIFVRKLDFYGNCYKTSWSR